MKSIDSNRWDKEDDRVKKVVVHHAAKNGFDIEVPLEDLSLSDFENYYGKREIIGFDKRSGRKFIATPGHIVDSLVDSYMLDMLMERM